MRLHSRLLAVAAALALSLVAAPVRAAAGPAGHWEGKIQMPNHELGFTVDLDQGPKGEWIGSLTITGSASVDVPLVKITVSGTSVQFSASLPGETSFAGTLSAGAGSLDGKASNAEGGVPFHLARGGDAKVKVPPPSSPLTKEFEGTWEGSMDAVGKILRVMLKLSAAPDGIAQARIAVVDSGDAEIPVTTVTVHGKELTLEVRSISGSYRGTLAASGEIIGEWSERTQKVPLTFKRAAVVPK